MLRKLKSFVLDLRPGLEFSLARLPQCWARILVANLFDWFNVGQPVTGETLQRRCGVRLNWGLSLLFFGLRMGRLRGQVFIPICTGGYKSVWVRKSLPK